MVRLACARVPFSVELRKGASNAALEQTGERTNLAEGR